VEGLSKALAEIGDYVQLSVHHAKLVNTAEMREAVSQIYATIFCFLREAMGWYKAKRLNRLVKSFDQNLYEKFSDILDKIKQRAEQIHKRGIIAHHAKTTDIMYETRNMNEKLDRLIITHEEDRKNLRGLFMAEAPYYAIDPWLQADLEVSTQIASKPVPLHISIVNFLLRISSESDDEPSKFCQAGQYTDSITPFSI
jgi:hypothetical protein